MDESREIIQGLKKGYAERIACEKLLYQKYSYLIKVGSRKFQLSYEDSFSAYSDTVLSVIQNIVNDRFEQQASLKTYLFRVFSNKCIDLVRKNSINKTKVNKSAIAPELLNELPDKAKSAIELLMDRYKEGLLREYLMTIGEKCREILLFFEDGYTDQEIAERLAYNNAAVVKTTRHRCIEKLKEKMSQLLKLT